MILPLDALETILQHVKPTGEEKLPLFEATGRVVSRTAVSMLNLPPMDNAAMDGYALRFEDIREIPATLKIKGTIKAGDRTEGLRVEKGECYRIMTGAFIPEGADTVVEFEAAREEGDRVTILKQKKRASNVRFKGEDIKKGDPIDFIGEPINPYRLSRLISTGNTLIDVYRKPTVCVIATGNELAYPGYQSELSTVDSNSFFIKSLLKSELDIDIAYLGIVSDEPEKLIETLNQAAAYDVIITTAGISFGDYDVVTNVEKKVGINWSFKYVKQKPGKPFAFGTLKDSLIFSFPGNPVSTAFCSFFYLIPALKKMMGYRDHTHRHIEATLTEDVKKNNDRVHFNRVRVELKEDTFYATPYETQGSNIIESIARCNGFAMIDADKVGIIKKGSRVKVFLYDFGSVF